MCGSCEEKDGKDGGGGLRLRCAVLFVNIRYQIVYLKLMKQRMVFIFVLRRSPLTLKISDNNF